MAVATETENKAAIEVKWWYLPLLLAIPAAGVMWFLNRETGSLQGQLTVPVFITAAVGLIPLATMIGDATELLASYVGPVAGGLLNATFSNVPELAIGIFLLLHAHLNAGSLDVVRSDHEVIRFLLVGSVINNVLLVLGASIFVAALRHGRMQFSKESAAGYASMLALAVVGLALPTLAKAFVPDPNNPANVRAIENVSLLVGVVLVVTYVAYIGATVFGWRDKPAGDEAANLAEPSARGRDFSGIVLPLMLFVILTLLTVGIAFVLVDTTDHVIANTPLTSLSVGLIIFPILCNVGELAGVAESAMHRNMEQAMAIAGGSAVQVPLLVAPLVIFIAYLFSGGAADQMLQLVFQPLVLIVVGLVTFVYALVSLDGETTWLEGLQLLAFYAMIAVTALALPGR
jgi:Ca2+:H+ antiporter